MVAKSKLKKHNILKLISKDLIDSYISHDEFVLINNEQKEHCLCFLKCRKNTESENPKVVKMKNRRTMLLSNREVCVSK